METGELHKGCFYFPGSQAHSASELIELTLQSHTLGNDVFGSKFGDTILECPPKVRQDNKGTGGYRVPELA